MKQLWLIDHNLSSRNPNDIIQKGKTNKRHRGTTSMKEVWPNIGHKVIKLIDKVKTLKLNLKKGSQDNLFYGRVLTLICY